MNANQCKMARVALDWTTRKLAEAAGVGLNTVNRFEGGMNSRKANVAKIRSALESSGIEFADDGSGVRRKQPKEKDKPK